MGIASLPPASVSRNDDYIDYQGERWDIGEVSYIKDLCIPGNFAIGEGFSSAANSTVGTEF
jgi:hypothetical protein